MRIPKSTFNTILLSSLLGFLTNCRNEESRLPILGERQPITKEINGKRVVDTMYHTIPDFAFLNQDSSWISAKTFENKIYVADFFFTTCPTICPIMKTQMLRIYEEFKEHPQVLILSHSIDPAHDTVAILREFAQRLGVNSRRWHFITGDKDQIYELGQNNYLVTTVEDENEPGGIMHSGTFILVDKQRRIRGLYDGTSEKEVNKLMKDMKVLLNEYESR